MPQHEGRGPSHAYGAAAIAKCIHGTHFPVTKNDLMSKYGSCQIEYRKGETVKFRDLLEDVDTNTFNSPVEVEQAISNK